MRIKTTTCLPHPSESGCYQNSKDNQPAQARMWGEEDPYTLLVEYELVQPLWKIVWWLLKNKLGTVVCACDASPLGG